VVDVYLYRMDPTVIIVLVAIAVIIVVLWIAR
jgi:hypothetical protein